MRGAAISAHRVQPTVRFVSWSLGMDRQTTRRRARGQCQATSRAKTRSVDRHQAHDPTAVALVSGNPIDEALPAVAVPRGGHAVPNVGRSSDFRAESPGLLVERGRPKRSRLLSTMACLKRTLYKNARLQRRGRPGFAPEFPVRRPQHSGAADHQRTFSR